MKRSSWRRTAGNQVLGSSFSLFFLVLFSPFPGNELRIIIVIIPSFPYCFPVIIISFFSELSPLPTLKIISKIHSFLFFSHLSYLVSILSASKNRDHSCNERILFHQGLNETSYSLLLLDFLRFFTHTLLHVHFLLVCSILDPVSRPALPSQSNDHTLTTI